MNRAYHLQQLLAGPQASLPVLLDQKERRARHQQTLLARGGCLICFTLNIAGPVKTSPALTLAFAEGRRRIMQQLRWHSIPVMAEESLSAVGGQELYVLADAPPEEIKPLMVEIEDGFPVGRLFDMDVISREDGILSRETLGYPPRKCLLCQERAVLCARGKTHSRAALLEKTIGLICDHFNSRYADTVAQLCCRALLCEVAVTPKPGLVDRANSGSHTDMDFFSFMGSTCALAPYFRQCVLQGIEGSGLPPRAMFGTLRYPGRLAEDDMLRATGGVNTHKGAIFSMGILCAAMGRLYDSEHPWCTADVLSLCRQMCAGLVADDMAALNDRAPLTAGEGLYRRCGIGGARGEAAAGFPSVAEIGLPALKHALAEGMSLNDAGVLTLLHLMAHVEDTNIIHRSSREEADQLRQQLRTRLESGPVTLAEVHALDENLSRRGISPGGCADLLAISILLWLAEEEDLPAFPSPTA